MSTITIDTALYENATSYAQRHRTSIRRIVEDYIAQLVGKETKDRQAEYYISPAVRALSTGFKAPDGLSADYKKEMSDYHDSKYL